MDLRKRQVELLAKGMKKNTIRLAESIHTIGKNTTNIDNKIKSIFRNFNSNKELPTKLFKEISTIKLLNHKSFIMTKYAFKGKFGLKSKIITDDLGVFIMQYISVILDSSNITTVFSEVYEKGRVFSFDTTVIGIIIDNLYSNSIKAHASNMIISLCFEDSYAILSFADDGDGFDRIKFPDPDIFFELGAKNPLINGLGIGLYHIKELLKSNQGEVLIDKDYNSGFKIIIKLKSEVEVLRNE